MKSLTSHRGHKRTVMARVVRCHDREFARLTEKAYFVSIDGANRMIPPAEKLEGKVLAGGWVVGAIVPKSPTGTGGWFSTGYLVSKPDGTKGYLKAMDYWGSFASPSPADALKRLTESYIFEREMCKKCSTHRITRVIHALDYGTFVLPGPLGNVEYLIFELADADIRAVIDKHSSLDYAFALQVLHGTASALHQLHQADMAHQDLKPSNVLILANRPKLGDLGRAWSKVLPAPHDCLQIAGDRTYAPPELHYDGVALSEEEKRFGYDTYLLGSMVVFLFTRLSVNALIEKHLDPTFLPGTGLRYVDALPYLQAAFGDALAEFSVHVPACIREGLTAVVAELCDPDYTQRGNPIKRSIRRYSLVRYVSLFNHFYRRVLVMTGKVS